MERYKQSCTSVRFNLGRMAAVQKLLVFNEDPFRIVSDDQKAFRVPAPSAAELVSVLRGAGYQVSEIRHEGFFGEELDPAEWDVLVMPYGGLYPAGSWPLIRRYLEAGGNLLTLGGLPFTRALEKKGKVWPCSPMTTGIANGELRLRKYEVEGFSRLEACGKWAEILGFDGMPMTASGIGLTAGSYVPSESIPATEKSRDVAYPLAFTDRFGLHRGHGALVLKNHALPFRNSKWVLIGSLRPSDPGWEKVVLGVAGYLSRRVGLRTLAASRPAYDDPQEVAVTGRIVGGLPGGKMMVEVRFGTEPGPRANGIGDSGEKQLLGPGERTAVGQGPVPRLSGQTRGEHTIRAEVALDDEGNGSFELVPSEFGLALEGDFYEAGASLLSEEGVPVDYFACGFVMLSNRTSTGFVDRRPEGGFFRSQGSTLPMIGGNYFVTGTGLNGFENYDPLYWYRDFQAMRSLGMTSVRSFIPRRFFLEGDSLSEKKMQACDAMTYLMLRLGVTPLICAHSAHMIPGRDPRADKDIRPAQFEWTRYCAERYKGAPVLWDLENEDGIHRVSQQLKDNYLTFVPNRFLEEEWNKWLSQEFSPDELARLWKKNPPRDGEPPFPLPGTGPQDFDDPRERAWQYFASLTFREWMAAIAPAIREADPNIPVTYSHWHDAVYEIFDRYTRETNGDPWFTHDPLDFNCLHVYWDQFDNHANELLQDPITCVKYCAPEVFDKPMVIGETSILSEVAGDEDAYARFVEDWVYGMLAGGGQGLYMWTWDAHLSNGGDAGGELLRLDGTPRKPLRRMRDFSLLSRQLRFVRFHAEVFLVNCLAAKIGGGTAEYVRSFMEALHTAYAAHIPFQVIADKDLGRLPGNAKALIIPSPLCMMEETWQLVKRFLVDGGVVYVSGSFNKDEWRLDTYDRMAEILGEDADEKGEGTSGEAVIEKKVGLGHLIFVPEPVEYLRRHRTRGPVIPEVDNEGFLDDEGSLNSALAPSPLSLYRRVAELCGTGWLRVKPDREWVWVVKRPTGTGHVFVIRDKSYTPEVQVDGLSITTKEFGVVEVIEVIPGGPAGVVVFEGTQLAENSGGRRPLISVSSRDRAIVFANDREPISRSKAIVVKFKEPGTAWVRTDRAWERPVACSVLLDDRGARVLEKRPIHVVNDEGRPADPEDGGCALQVSASLEDCEYPILITDEPEVEKEARRLGQSWLL